jgi:hypothetical protein
MNFSERPIVFGVRWQAKRDTALGEDIPTVHAPQTFESAVVAALRLGRLPAQSIKTKAIHGSNALRP